MNTLLIANPVAANLVEQAASIGRGVRVAGIASDNNGRNGVGDADLRLVVEAVDIVDVRVDFGFRVAAVVLIELVVHIAGQLAFVEQFTQESRRQFRKIFKPFFELFVIENRKVVGAAGAFAGSTSDYA